MSDGWTDGSVNGSHTGTATLRRLTTQPGQTRPEPADAARFLLRHAHEGHAILGEDGRLTEVIGSTGAPWEAGVGTRAVGWVHDEDVAVAWQVWERVLASPGEPCSTHLRAVDDTGATRHYGLTLTNWLDDPVVQGVVVNYQDVTDTAQRDAQVAFQSRLLDAIAEAVVATEPTGAIIHWNKGAEQLYGWRASEVLGRNILDVTPASTTVEQAADIFTALQAGETWSGDIELQRRDGRVFPAFVSHSPVFDESGALTAVIGVSMDLTDRRRAEEALAHGALHDALTGLPNRLLLIDRVGQAITTSGAHRGPPAVLFLDLDHFQIINESLGYAAGDEILVEIAQRLIGAAGGTDTVARFAGDQFLVLTEASTSRAQLRTLAAGLRAALDEPFRADGRDVFVTASIGVARADTHSSPDTLVRNAAAAMYRAKHRGRGDVEFFKPHLHRTALRRLEHETALRYAVDHDELEVYYQPVVTFAGGLPAGVEALVRWNRPGVGVVPPDEFIARAEQTGLIVPIGEWVLEQALRQMGEWRAGLPGADDLWVAVNVSARQIESETFVARVEDAVRRQGVPAEALHLEVTESALMRDPARAAGTLHRLRELGARIAIDDFGTGYSSLSYLRRFPVTALKIDRSFVAGLQHNPDDVAIVRAVVSLGQALGLTTIAEGVERATQARHLDTLGCDLGQGYYWQRPAPAAAAEDWLRAAAGQRPQVSQKPHAD